MLHLESVSKRFSSGKYGVRDLSLDVKGGVLGLLGPNGAGKTTLMQMIATVTKPSSGRILFQGSDIAKRPDDLRRRLGYLPQDFGVYDNLTAFEFLTYFASLKGVHDRKRIGEMLEMVNLHAVAGRTVGGFSGGMKQRLGIAQALINDPDLVIVDEPTAGLDPEERVRFRNILSDIGFGKLVILSTHIVSDIESIATEIAIMNGGALVAMASPEAQSAKDKAELEEIVVTATKRRERIEDVPILTNHLWRTLAARTGSRAALSPAATVTVVASVALVSRNVVAAPSVLRKFTASVNCWR